MSKILRLGAGEILKFAYLILHFNTQIEERKPKKRKIIRTHAKSTSDSHGSPIPKAKGQMSTPTKLFTPP
jgi:hypothetical protein